jgi:hypothetical protein
LRRTFVVNRTSDSYVITLSLAAAVTALVGCGGTYDASVEGLVTLDGNALPTGSISFVPVNGGPQAYAMVDTSGNYEVYTGREAGLPAGEYAVAIVARKPSTAMSAGNGPPPPGEQITPRKYASADTSGLRFTVDPGSNEINIELTSQPPSG